MSRLLLIEPDAVLARLYTKALSREGHKIKWVRGAQTAIHETDSFKPDLVLLELNLPKNNGVEFIYELRSYPEWQSLPIIILSQIDPRALDVGINVWKEMGISDVLYKSRAKLADLNHQVSATLNSQWHPSNN